VSNFVGGNVSAYTINASTGTLTQIDCGGGAGCNGKNFLAGSSPNSITVDPSGRFAYVANFGGGDVSAYTINASTGALTAIDADTITGGIQNFTAGSNPISVTVDPSGEYAYVVNQFGPPGTVSAYTIDGSTGALTQIDCGGGTGCTGANFVAGTSPSSVVTTGTSP
jgi:6-phosphogluconolactonase (cycloisomerase 2 family)